MSHCLKYVLGSKFDDISASKIGTLNLLLMLNYSQVFTLLGNSLKGPLYFVNYWQTSNCTLDTFDLESSIFSSKMQLY